ncbi:hypothetical protein H0H87_010340 [Tephrocybe sp. NHM501043]|nr:hypothetical protein H0H87_010340 [Tephrocybe sp. NHM501043]
MGTHSNQQIHRRVAALKQRRLPPDEEAAKLKELIARYSPTFVWTATLTDDAAPTTVDTPATIPDTTTDAPVTTPAASVPTPAATPPTTVATTAPTDSPNTAPTTSDVVTTSPTETAANVVTTPVTTNTPVIVNTTPTTTLPTSPTTTPVKSTLVITTGSSTIASAAASATQTDTSGSGTNVGGIVGGLAGALLGLAALIFVVRFLMKRRSKHNDEDNGAFNANDFRRSAVLMDDPPTHDETVERGFNPRPPTMIERRLASPAPTFGTQYGAPGPALGLNDYDYNQYQAYGPAQLRSSMSATPMLNDSAYPNPAYPQPAYGQSPFSPIGSPVSAAGANPYDGSQQAAILTRQPSNTTQLSRSPSANGPNGYPSEDPHYGGYPVPGQNDYIDLDRSSVSPYQAAQYAEISQKLNTDVPSGLDTPVVNELIQNQVSNVQAPPVPVKSRTPSPSPFSDPAPGTLPYPGDVTPRASTNLDDFPAPPSPSHSSRSRVESIPPTLPEIHVESRPSSYDFPASVRGSETPSSFPSGVTKDYTKSPLGNQFPATPSPLASSFAIPSSPPAVANLQESPPPTPRLNKTETPAKRPDTVYDDDDAYGGI